MVHSWWPVRWQACGGHIVDGLYNSPLDRALQPFRPVIFCLREESVLVSEIERYGLDIVGLIQSTYSMSYDTKYLCWSGVSYSGVHTKECGNKKFACPKSQFGETQKVQQVPEMIPLSDTDATVLLNGPCSVSSIVEAVVKVCGLKDVRARHSRNS